MNTGSSSTRVGVYEPLTTWEMYLKLKEKRFHPTTPVVVPGKLNADRRLSFMANPDPYAIAAIMTTAPKIEVIPLIDFFYYYISFLPDIRFSKTPRGYMNVVQQFHLPFYSWRSTRQEPKDNRLKTDNSPLRKVYNVQFLRGEPSDTTSEIDYLCEGQISVLITAIDRRIWTGYCFVDTYYQEESRKQSVGGYCKDDSDEDGLQTDPFTNGECDSNKPILDPGHYFLTALDSQLRVCYFEWTDTAHQIRARVQQYINKFASSSPKLQASSFEEDEEPSEWLCQTRHMLTLLVESLDNTIHCLDNYACKDHNLSPYEHRCFECIRQTISDLKICLRELRGVLSWCDEHERALNLRNIDAQKKVSRLQTTSAQHNQTATYFLLYIVSPITVAAAMLSMQEKAIPSILGPNKSSFIVLAPVLGVLVAALARLIHSRESILPALGEWVQRWQMKRQLDRDIELENV
uniref:WGS project CBMI000000000 data, contig CS3069_c003326 n=1 Tax=Fusarium clavum TaxID=2594811 RepID=A0A090MDL2_9HYPO|nr:unnamed protein product [Fusarium clavum]